MIDFDALLNWAADRWLPLAGLLVAIIFGTIRTIPIYNARKQRKLDAARNEPGVKATINRTPSVDGWRSIQLHITPPPAQAATFRFGKRGWRIVNAKLLSPRNVELAFANDDDHSLTGPIVRVSPRMMSGRVNHPQPFAMEFFYSLSGHSSR
ncbi:MAG: hypothetical protein WEA28_06190 [Xanthobacteraceae bacterium]